MLQTHITCITIAELLILHTFDVLNCKFFVFFFFGSMTAPPINIPVLREICIKRVALSASGSDAGQLSDGRRQHDMK